MDKKCPLCWVEEHAGNPGNPDKEQPLREKLERYEKRKALEKVAEDLAEKDAVSDALWDLRGEVLTVLKELKLVSPEVMGSEVQGYIDRLILRLVHLV